jgi:hypothetical protein
MVRNLEVKLGGFTIGDYANKWIIQLYRILYSLNMQTEAYEGKQVSYVLLKTYRCLYLEAVLMKCKKW